MPASQMGEQPGGNRNSRLALVRFCASLFATIVAPAVQIDECSADRWNRRSRSDRTSTRTTIDPDQNKSREVSNTISTSE